MDNSYDLVVLGGGPGGYVAAIRAGQYGLKTALVEKDALGGTCLNRGCIPTKAMLHTSEVLNEIRHAGSIGIEVGEPSIKLEKVYSYKDGVVKKLVGGVGSLLKANGVDVYRGVGEFVDAHRLKVAAADSKDGKGDPSAATSKAGKTAATSKAGKTAGSDPSAASGGEAEQTVSAGHILIATGSRPSIPPIPGLEETGYWTSKTLLEENPELPESILIIGGGVIGTECATILGDLGVEVTIVEMMEQLIPQMDGESAETLRKSLKKDGVKIHTGVKVSGVSGKGSGGSTVKVCKIETGKGEEHIEAAEIMVATGRAAVTDIPGVDKLGLAKGRGGFEVNENLQTSLPHIYAIGDVNGAWQLAHAASADGIAAVDHIAGKRNYSNRNIVPSCIYTRPEIASVGMSAAEAEEKGYKVAEGRFPMAANGKAMIMGEKAGFSKIVSDEETGEILGAQIVGPRATDMIGELTAAMSAEVTVEELGAAIHPHPTVSETIMEALHDVEGLSAHKPPAKPRKGNRA